MTSNRVHVRWLEGGRPVRALRFAPEDLDLLELAIDRSKSATRLENVGRIKLKIDGEIEIGAGRNRVAARLVTSAGPSRNAMHLEGAELVALALAVAELRQMTAATAASQEYMK